MASTESLGSPRWDLTPLFSSTDDPRLRAELNAAQDRISQLRLRMDALGVRRLTPTPITAELIAAFEEITPEWIALQEAIRPVSAYLHGVVSTDAGDEAAQALASELRSLGARAEPLSTRFIAWAGTLDAEGLLSRSELARGYLYPLRAAAEQAEHQMSEAEEELQSFLRPAAITAWARLHSDLTSLLVAAVPLPGGDQTMSISAVRNLGHDPDRSIREIGYRAELAAWDTVALPLAAAMNGVKGWQCVLNRRRGYSTDVGASIPRNSIDADTLDAMQVAVVESFPDFRRYLKAKARRLGVNRLAWYDLHAPVANDSRLIPWSDAEQFVVSQFRRYSDSLAAFAERAFRERWIDAEPRSGKEDGGYCMGIGQGDSRILMNYDGSVNQIATLAHELGHAYHNQCLKGRDAWQRRTPSTLAETASIFCETLATEGALVDASGEDRLALIEASLQRDLLVVVDIHSRFLFEKAVLERRASRELSAPEFCELMEECQDLTYGDGLDPAARHRYMWAVKGHYYGPLFYNYPYTFGLLFGLGLYSCYRSEPDAFRGGYDDLLSSTGLADAAELGRRFDIDTRSVEFWRSSLDVCRGWIEEFVGAVDGAA